MSITCEHCRKVYEEWPGKFCDRCGRALTRMDLNDEDDDVYKKCGKCGHRNTEDKRLCDNCGELLHEPQI